MEDRFNRLGLQHDKHRLVVAYTFKVMLLFSEYSGKYQKRMIDSYNFSRIVINGRKYTSDVIIYPDKVDGNWWRREGHRLYVEDMEEIIREKPEMLVVVHAISAS